MKTIYGSCILFLLSISSATAALDGYTVSRTAPNCACYADIVGGAGTTAVTSWRNGTSTDDNLSQTLNIGFSFDYDGSPQTQFRVSTNGFITFNTATNATGDYLTACDPGDAYSGDNTNFSISGAKGSISVIAPFFDDLIVNGYTLNSSMHYQTSGIAPDRILTVQWRGMSKDVSSNCSNPCTYGNYNFQIKLYETSGNIEFIYGTMTTGGDELSKNYSCGINSASAQLLVQQSANSATFNANAVHNLSTVPQANSRITFTRILPAPATGAPTCVNYNFPTNGASNLCTNSIISWSACDGVPTAYNIYFGTTNPPPLAASNLTGNFYNHGSLSANTVYYWSVVPKNSFGDAVVANMPVYSFTTGAANSVTSIISSAGTTVCAGTNTTLTVNGSLADGGGYQWKAPFFGLDLGCNLNPPYPLVGNCEANSRNITFSSAGTNKFYVLAEGCNSTSSCISITITVLANSTAPTSISSSAGTSFCGGTPTTLTANGGTHASGAQYAWYSGSCGGTLLSGTSASITVTPSANTTYFVKRTGACPATGTTCASVAITVTNPAVGNNSIISGNQTICAGQLPVTIIGSLPTGGNIFTYQWESSTTSDTAGFTPVSGNSNIQSYLPPAVTVNTWFRRVVIFVDACATSSASDAVQVAIGSAQCNDLNACTDDVCENGTCIFKCTIAVSNVSSTNITVQGCSDGTVSATVSHPSCTGEWNALLYNGNTIQKSWNSSQGATILWNNVPVGNYLLVATDFGDCSDSAQVSIGTTLSCSIQINNLNSTPTTVAGCSDGSISATVQAVVCNGEWFATLFNGANAVINTWLSGQGNSIVWNNLPAGSYRVFVTDNKACSINQNITVSSGSACSIAIQNVQKTIADCDNNTITAAISALTCNNTWVAYLYNSDYSEVLQTWSSSSGSSIVWSDVSLGTYHILAESFSGCSDTADVELSCSDNDPCTNDLCVGGCSHPLKCNDNNLCTTDNCNASGQCTNQPIVCTDNNACTIDICSGGNCVFNPRNCNDNNACTTDGCTGGICTHTNVCTGVTLSGYIKTAIDTPIAGVSVILSGTVNDTAVTGNIGFYSFVVLQGGNYTVTASKTNDIVTNNGITSLDISLIRRHVLGILPLLDSPYKIIAADASNSGTVTTGDIPFVRLVVLSNTTRFPPSNSRLWEFVSSYNTATNPFPFVKTKTYTNLLVNQTNQNFIGVKVGDVNNSWSTGTP